MKVVNRRTDYEWPVALRKFGGNQIPSLLMSDWAKKGVRVSRRFFGDFLCVQKVTRVRAGEAREPKSVSARFGNTRGAGAEPLMIRVEVGTGKAP